MKRLVTICAIVSVVAGSADAGLTVYTDQGTWSAGLSAPINTINWDDVVVPVYSTTIAGDHYSGMFGSPMLSVDAASTLYVVKPAAGPLGPDFYPVSGENVFTPDLLNPQGVLTISFAKPMYAVGVWFLDVEHDYDSTGIEVGGALYAFSSNQGDDSQSFLGIVSSNPFTSANIHMSSDPGGNGVGIDDVMYAVPVPGAVLLGMIGLGAVGVKLRKFA